MPQSLKSKSEHNPTILPAPPEPSLYWIVKEESDTTIYCPTTDLDLAFRRFSEWFNEFVRILQDEHDYEKYKDYLIELSKIMGTIRRLCKETKR